MQVTLNILNVYRATGNPNYSKNSSENLGNKSNICPSLEDAVHILGAACIA